MKQFVGASVNLVPASMSLPQKVVGTISQADTSNFGRLPGTISDFFLKAPQSGRADFPIPSRFDARRPEQKEARFPLREPGLHYEKKAEKAYNRNLDTIT
ncbi:MAG: hypothetical protein WAU88_03045 [Candidatus Zixiibacteriota bacterium]